MEGRNEWNQNRLEMQWYETKMENGKFYDSLLNLGNVIGSLIEESLFNVAMRKKGKRNGENVNDSRISEGLRH